MSQKCIIWGIKGFETLKKNGSRETYFYIIDRRRNELECFLKKKILFIRNNRPNPKNLEKEIINRKYSIQETTKKNLKYYIKLDKNNLMHYVDTSFEYFYREKDIDLFIKYYYLSNQLSSIKKNDWLKKAGIQYLLSKIKIPTMKEKQIYIELFYRYYVTHLLDEVKEIYGTNILTFNNFEELYIYLNKKGYAKKYYDTIIHDIKKKSIEIDKSIDKKELNKLKIKILNKSTIYKLDKKVYNYIK